MFMTNNKSTMTKKKPLLLSIVFDGHTDLLVQYHAHCPMVIKTANN
jgi:hypothetical protein